MDIAEIIYVNKLDITKHKVKIKNIIVFALGYLPIEYCGSFSNLNDAAIWIIQLTTAMQ